MQPISYELHVADVLPMSDYYGIQEYTQGMPSLLDPAILSQYCMCDLGDVQYPIEYNIPTTGIAHSFDLINNNKKLNIDDKHLERKLCELIDTLNELIWNPKMVIIHGKKKAERKGNSSRRSAFIGVSRNGPNWQAMISIKKRKAYIGTYQTEKEAAMAFDFYSVLIHAIDAKTNFSYTKDDIMSMIYSFRMNGNTFIPKAMPQQIKTCMIESLSSLKKEGQVSPS